MPYAELPSQAEGARIEGWSWVYDAAGARIACVMHYFRLGQSLCNRWGLHVTPTDGFLPDRPDPDNCPDCWRKRQKELGIRSGRRPDVSALRAREPTGAR